MQQILKIEGLKTVFESDEGVVKAVDGINFDLKRGQILGVVGESGCGKTVTALSILQLIRPPKGKIVSGQITYYYPDGRRVEITSLKPNSKEMRKIRGKEISMIFQDPMMALNPVLSVGEQIMESLTLHHRISKTEAREKAIKILEQVGISAAGKRIDEYPHEFSGGMQQRVMIAIALCCAPSVVIADEPTTALDVTVEAQILDLIREEQKKNGLSVIMITHDLGVVSEITDTVIIMYAGQIVEHASTAEIINNPKHPYTKGLLQSRPQIGQKDQLVPIEGMVPNLTNLPEGCYFAPRCSQAEDICYQQSPPTFILSSDQSVKCWLYNE